MRKILISKTQKSDLDSIISMENDIENSKFIFPNTKEEHLQLLSNNDIEHLLLKSKNDEIIGFAILAGLKDANRNIEFRRIVIQKKGKGFGRIAIKRIKHYCFESLNCHRLWLDVLETNSRARYLYASEGFKEEGTLHNCILIDNNFESLVLMSILEEEFKK